MPAPVYKQSFATWLREGNLKDFLNACKKYNTIEIFIAF